MKRMSPAEERFFKSLELWNRPHAHEREKVLDARTDVSAVVDQLFDELVGRISVIPR